ncbi:MAG: hypothetical protein H6Q24_1407, partial [Bacteroidetes bacterium]|nr:hypothetical protein [Bacteroidota bacterium]
EIMTGIRDKSHGVRNESIEYFKNNENDIQGNSCFKGITDVFYVIRVMFMFQSPLSDNCV